VYPNPIYTDLHHTLTGYACFQATQQTFGVAVQYSTGFQQSQFPPDGLMGMGFKAISTFRANPVFQTLISQGTVANRVFAFKLATTGSELCIGGTNSALYVSPFSYTSVTKQVRVSSSTCGVPFELVVDC
jgi:hypothetical protein